MLKFLERGKLDGGASQSWHSMNRLVHHTCEAANWSLRPDIEAFTSSIYIQKCAPFFLGATHFRGPPLPRTKAKMYEYSVWAGRGILPFLLFWTDFSVKFSPALQPQPQLHLQARNPPHRAIFPYILRRSHLSSLPVFTNRKHKPREDAEDSAGVSDVPSRNSQDRITDQSRS